MQIHSVGIDLGKTTFHLVALGTAGKVLGNSINAQGKLWTLKLPLVNSMPVLRRPVEAARLLGNKQT